MKKTIARLKARKRFLVGLIAPSKFDKNPIWISSAPHPFENEPTLTAEIYHIFQRAGTDKSSNHAYHFPYGFVLGKLGKLGSILEIGVGSTRTEIPFNMSWKENYKPGSSLYAWRALGFSKVVGADIDPVEFDPAEDLECLFVDQTRLESLLELTEQLKRRGLMPLDLIVDDGIHHVEYNLLTFQTLAGLLQPRGIYVIEDLKQSDLWSVLLKLQELGYSKWHLWMNPSEGKNCAMIMIEMDKEKYLQ